MISSSHTHDLPNTSFFQDFDSTQALLYPSEAQTKAFGVYNTMLGRPSAFDHIKPIAGWPAHSPSGQLTPPCWPDSKDFLSPSHIGYDISRPSSVTSTHSAPPLAHNIPFKGAYAHNVQLPALSTLASLAAASIPANDRAYQASHPQFSINAPLPLPGASVCAAQTGPVSLCNNMHTC